MSSRVILVVGANKGIGYEAVKYLAQQLPDATILLSSRSVENGEAALKEMKASVTAGHAFDNVKVIQLDITDRSSLGAAVEHVRSTYGKLDDLLHNSGISSHDGDLLSPVVLDVNVKGARDTIEAFFPLMPAKSARISLVSSEVGAWYLAELDETTREGFTNADQVNWTTTEASMKDWAKFAQGKPAEIKWAPVDKPYNQAYFASKALLTSWARGWAKRNPDYKLAVVCPGYCATALNGFSGPRHASVGGESVAWPLLNEFESGEFYQDGKKLAIVQKMPDAMRSLFEKNSSQ